MKQPLVMDGKFFLYSLMIAGIAIIGSLLFASVFIGLWYWKKKKGCVT